MSVIVRTYAVELKRQTELIAEAVSKAADVLKKGGLVALPTETVYGLAANALDSEAVRSIYLAKGRPTNNPLIVHISNLEMAKRCVSVWPDEAQILAESFWPGPLTMVLPRKKFIPDIVTGGGDTVAIRCPDNPIFRAVIETCGFPLAAPSANRSNHISPTMVEHVRISLGDKIPLILDGGVCPVGIESTVVDLSRLPEWRVLRPGMITKEEIDSVLTRAGKSFRVIFSSENLNKSLSENINIFEKAVLKSPGQLKRHYSPRTPLYLFDSMELREIKSFFKNQGVEISDCVLIRIGESENESPFAKEISMPRDPGKYAVNLYDTLYRCDEMKLKGIIVQMPEDTPAWQGIRDRLRRAAVK